MKSGSGKAKKEILEFAEAVKKNDGLVGDAATKMFKQGLTAKDAMQMSPVALENIYAQAYRLYNNGKYLESSHLFRLLILMNSMEPKYMLGFAACFHMLKEFQNAVDCYTLCSAIDAENPLPHYHASDCYIQMGDKISSMVALEMAVTRAENKPEFSKLKERCLMGLESLKKELKENT